MAERVSRRLVAAGMLLDDDPETALEHAQAARQEGSRLAVVREACGIAAYRAGKYDVALAELRAARRMNGSQEYLPMMADSERGLGRLDRALELIESAPSGLDRATVVELKIVEAGVRRDLGEPAAAVQVLEGPELRMAGRSWSVRLWYAYADALEAAGRAKEAEEWFARVVEADVELDTDAAERRAALATGGAGDTSG